MPFLHLPIQSGSDKVLKEMNRKHTVDFYRKIVDKLRAERSDIALSSDFIVGYPNETDKDFEDTMKFVNEVGFVIAYSLYIQSETRNSSIQKDNIPSRKKSKIKCITITFERTAKKL